MTSRTSSNRTLLIIIVAAVLLAMLVCCAVLTFTQLRPLFSSESGTPEVVSASDPREATLRVAYSPEKAALFTELVAAFNAQKLRTPDRRTMEVQADRLDVEAMLEAALDGRYEAISPDSSLWFD